MSHDFKKSKEIVLTVSTTKLIRKLKKMYRIKSKTLNNTDYLNLNL